MFRAMKNRLSAAVAAFCCIVWLGACSKPDASSTAGGNAGRAVPFNDIMGHGYCTIEGLARLAEQVYPDLM